VSRHPKELPEILLTIAETVSNRLMERGIDDGTAAEIGVDCADVLRHTFGGETIYLPKFLAAEFSKRDLKIIEMLKTCSMRDVCEKYGITTRRIYQILKGVRDGIEVPEQLDLFRSSDEEESDGC